MFIGEEPLPAIGRIIKSKTAARDMKALLADVAKDETGEALEGVKAAAKLWFRQQFGGAVEEGAGLSKINKGVLERLLKQGSNECAGVAQIFNKPGELALLDKAHEQLLILARQEGTAGKTQVAGKNAINNIRIVFASAFGIIKGGAIFQLGRYMQSLFGIDPKKGLQRLVFDALMDPKLLKVLKTMDTDKLQPITRNKMRTYILNNALDQDEDLQEDDEGEKS